MYRILASAALILTLAGCGGTAEPVPSQSPAPPPSPPPPSPSPAPGGGAVTTPVAVTVLPGTTALGVDIAVASHSASTPPNAENLGVASVSGSASAFNTGDTIRRGETRRVVLFGPGLAGSMTVTVLGPPDIQVAGARSIRADDDTPGISFTASVAANAALGARTVILRSTGDDITTFTGGLEVVP